MSTEVQDSSLTVRLFFLNSGLVVGQPDVESELDETESGVKSTNPYIKL